MIEIKRIDETIKNDINIPNESFTLWGKCVGLAIYRHDWLKYLYHDDLKVCKDYRGIYTIGQDNNLSACLFYIKSGFEIGGFNTHGYRGTNQAHKSNIYFYLDI